MGRLNVSYGSELHLLRYLGRHREEFNRRVGERVGAHDLRWLDFGFTEGNKSLDAEPKGIAWLRPGGDLVRAWSEFWPATGEQMNWDAVGCAKISGNDVWLLVEAKAHVGELRSRCVAKPADKKGGRDEIKRTFSRVRKELGIVHDRSWLVGYYQYCNRLATLHFLRQNGLAAELVCIYFTGDRSGRGRKCPRNAGEWEPALRRMHEYIGLPRGHELNRNVHALFLPVSIVARH